MNIAGLKKSVNALVARAGARLQTGEVDLSGIEEGVHQYCRAIASLPREEARLHEADLKALMDKVTELGEKLTHARDEVKAELQSLERMKSANIAYHKTGHISGPLPKKKEAE